MQDPRHMDKETEGGQNQRDRYRDRLTDLMKDPRHMDRQKKKGGQKQRDRHRVSDRRKDLTQDPRHMDRQTDRQRGTETEGQTNGVRQMNRPHA